MLTFCRASHSEKVQVRVCRCTRDIETRHDQCVLQSHNSTQRGRAAPFRASRSKLELPTAKLERQPTWDRNVLQNGGFVALSSDFAKRMLAARDWSCLQRDRLYFQSSTFRVCRPCSAAAGDTSCNQVTRRRLLAKPRKPEWMLELNNCVLAPSGVGGCHSMASCSEVLMHHLAQSRAMQLCMCDAGISFNSIQVSD